MTRIHSNLANFLRLALLSILCACVSTCGTLSHPLGGRGGQALREPAGVEDMNPDPRVVEFELVAAPAPYEFVAGRPTTMWLFNGQLPGPLIEANAGDEIVVHFRNELPEETTVHWHGIRLTADMDGSHLSQHPVAPGESFEYRFVVPDPGLYWYHPHHHGSTQVAMGLYGGLLVRAPDEPQLTRERVLVLSDALLDDAWQMVPPHDVALSPIDHAIGLHGSHLLINGQLAPNAEFELNGRERWRIVNACTSRYFRLALPGATLQQIGGDSGLADVAVQIDELTLAVGERADIVVTPQADELSLLSLPNKRIYGFNFEAGHEQSILQLRGVDSGLSEPPPLPQLAALPMPGPSMRERGVQFSAAIFPFLDGVLDREHVGESAGHAASHMHEQTRFFINGAAFPDVPIITAQLGTSETWRVNNHTEMDHPFHLHGFRFMVLDEDGIAPPQRMWKDTINIKGSQDGVHTVRLLVDFTGHPGEWVYHCHILHHQELGMMAQVNVE